VEHLLKPTNQELVEKACRGDVGSFRTLYERHYSMAVAIAYSRVHDRHLAEDAAQEAFVVACRQIHTLKEGARFPQWLGTIVRRSASAMEQRPQPGDSLQVELAATLDELEDFSFVRDAILRLPAAQREAIYLRYYSELSYEEIAETTGMTKNSIHGQLQRARRTLAKYLGKLSNR
jgi:RNA polymerase sigma-70 factor (ECF subfamily)